MSKFLSAAQERFVYGKLRQASRMDYGKRRMGTKLKERLYIISVIRSVSRCSYHDPYTTSMSLTQPHVNDVTRNLEQSSMSMGLLQLLDPRLSPQGVIPDHSPIFPVTKTAVQAVANAAHCTGIGI